MISPQFLSMMTEEGVFSIIDCYLRLAGDGEKISRSGQTNIIGVISANQKMSRKLCKMLSRESFSCRSI